MSTVATSAPAVSNAAPLSSMLTELQSAQQKVTALSTAIETERTTQLKALHVSLGYEDSEQLVAAIRQANGKGKRGASRKAGSAPRKARTVVTSNIKKAIIADAKEGKLTGLDIAKKHGVSVGTVQNIKKEAGLVS